MKRKQIALWVAPVLFACSTLSGLALDFETNAKPSKWFMYPMKKGLKTVLAGEKLDGKSVMEFDFRPVAGHSRILLPIGKAFKSISFKIKGLEDAKRKSVDLMLVESDPAGAEKHYKTLKFNGEWQSFTITPGDLRIFPYGGSKIVDKKLDVNNTLYLQMNCYPGGAHFLMSDIQIEYEDAAPAK